MQMGDTCCFLDVPAILVDDDDSVCYPCAMVDDQNTDNGPELNEDTDENKKLEKEAKHSLWQTLVGNGMIDRTQCQQKLVFNLLCFQCMQEQLETSNCVEDICLDDAMLVAMTSNVGFACILSIKCVHGHHQFTIEPLHVPSAVNTVTDKPPKSTKILQKQWIH